MNNNDNNKIYKIKKQSKSIHRHSFTVDEREKKCFEKVLNTKHEYIRLKFFFTIF